MVTSSNSIGTQNLEVVNPYLGSSVEFIWTMSWIRMSMRINQCQFVIGSLKYFKTLMSVCNILNIIRKINITIWTRLEYFNVFLKIIISKWWELRKWIFNCHVLWGWQLNLWLFFVCLQDTHVLLWETFCCKVIST